MNIDLVQENKKLEFILQIVGSITMLHTRLTDTHSCVVVTDPKKIITVLMSIIKIFHMAL